MADYELVKETMVELGEKLDAMGYDGVLEVIEGDTAVGAACRDCRTAKASKILAEHLKDLHQTFATRNPDPEGQKANAMKAVQEAWTECKAALNDDPNVAAELNTRPTATATATGAPQPRPAGVPSHVNMPTMRPAPGRGMPSFKPGMPSPPRR